MDRSSVVWLALDGFVRYGINEDLPSEFGAKARGLLWIPAAWVPPFFVIAPSVFDAYRQLPVQSRREFLESKIGPLISDATAASGIPNDAPLMLRSNAVQETIDERGRYESVVAAASTTIVTLDQLYEGLDKRHPGCNLGIVVQQAVKALAKGHLSNQRRVAEEYRDGLVEMEDANGDIHGRRTSYRRWRKGKPPTLSPLVCRSEDDILNSLRPVLAFSAQKRKRVLFEWVWDGQFVQIVQADLEQDSVRGIGPDAPLRGRIYEPVSATSLSCFVPLRASSSSSSGKLRNHAIYVEHGFWQPVFYELSNTEVLKAIIAGKELSDALEQDLRVLTQRPLVIRTSCSSGHAPLLPRSDELATPEAARNWLYGEFSARIRDRGLDLASISLLAHHYIPARVAAFSMGAEGRLEVQIASLWGIPEGLYYYPFDSYLVQTLGTIPAAIVPADYSRFTILRKIRYKSHFVAPNSDGTFVRHEVSRPWDWKQTIAESSTLAKMAAFTRALAQQEGHAVNVMWFLDCETVTGTIDAVPWYHEEFDATSEEIAFQRNAHDEELVIATEQDLAGLETRAGIGDKSTVGRRLVVKLFPTEDRAIRSEEFAKRVGEAAKRLDAVVVLSGATLSHVYYVLSRTGVHLSVQNQADMAVRSEIHEKLVRDRIPETVAATGEIARVATLTKEQTIAALRLKLVEEAFEARDAARGELVGELADVLEVVRELAMTTGIGFAAVERTRKKKAERRGAFKGGVVLLATGGSSAADTTPNLIGASDQDGSRVVRGPPPSLEVVRMGAADVRDTPEFVEHVQNATVPLTHPEWTIESPVSAELPEDFAADSISWSIDGRRNGTNLQLRIKIRIGTTQLELPLEHDVTDVDRER